jgi:hypothetical protein
VLWGDFGTFNEKILFTSIKTIRIWASYKQGFKGIAFVGCC